MSSAAENSPPTGSVLAPQATRAVVPVIRTIAAASDQTVERRLQVLIHSDRSTPAKVRPLAGRRAGTAAAATGPPGLSVAAVIGPLLPSGWCWGCSGRRRG